MRGFGFYTRLAWQGMCKNGRVYLPYILTCIGMVMMYYIVCALQNSTAVETMRGGSTVQEILSLGQIVIGFFSLLFLLYTNSFLLKRRKKEFGLYNILGMSKLNLARVLLLETLLTAALALLSGLGLGLLFSKLAELSLSRLLSSGPSLVFEISPLAIISTLKLFSLIFLLLLANSLRQVHMARPVELLRAPNFGERPPKANWLLALLGLILLAGAYFLAVTIKDPIVALGLFFVAVIMVIIATYLLFIAGSVALCRLLQKNPRFYYQTKHFVSTGNMLFRMRRNGAGLASICILSTMVLVMLSTTGCLFWGKEAALQQRFPQDIIFSIYDVFYPADEAAAAERPGLAERQNYIPVYRELIEAELARRGWQNQPVLDFRHLTTVAAVENSRLTFDQDKMQQAERLVQFKGFYYAHFIPLDDYNRSQASALELQPNEVFICENPNAPYTWNTLSLPQIEQLPEFKVKSLLPEFPHTSVSNSEILPDLWVVVPDEQIMQTVCNVQQQAYERASSVAWYYGFDLPETASPSESDEFVRVIWNQVDERTQQAKANGEFEPPNIHYSDINGERDWYYSMNSGMFFLAIVLALVFVAGALLIMYYKQLVEGYEDQAGFGILRKVGMTDREIRSSVNWQTLVLFFLPLVIAGIHLAFAFNMLLKLLLAFGLSNPALLVQISVICYLIFALLYIAAYLTTSRIYYRIVAS